MADIDLDELEEVARKALPRRFPSVAIDGADLLALIERVKRAEAVIAQVREWSARNGYPGPSADNLHAILATYQNGSLPVEGEVEWEEIPDGN